MFPHNSEVETVTDSTPTTHTTPQHCQEATEQFVWRGWAELTATISLISQYQGCYWIVNTNSFSYLQKQYIPVLYLSSIDSLMRQNTSFNQIRSTAIVWGCKLDVETIWVPDHTQL